MLEKIQIIPKTLRKQQEEVNKSANVPLLKITVSAELADFTPDSKC